MKCKDCECNIKGFFKCKPEAHVCIGVKNPFVIKDVNVECTEYPDKHIDVTTAEIKPTEPIGSYVGDDGIYVPSDYDFRAHKLLISKKLFVEAYNKWIKGDKHNGQSN